MTNGESNKYWKSLPDDLDALLKVLSEEVIVLIQARNALHDSTSRLFSLNQKIDIVNGKAQLKKELVEAGASHP